jgi:hypothetical protein
VNSNRAWGDRPFSRGHLYKILSNTIYAGKIAHKDKLYDGQHEAIIDRKIFAAVQAQLATNTRRNRTQQRAKDPNLLAGLLFDTSGARLTSSHTVKDGKRYRYYTGVRSEDGWSKAWRVPAPELEATVINELKQFLGDRQRIAGALKRSRLQARELKEALQNADRLRAQLDAFASRRDVAFNLIKRVVVSDSELVLELELGRLLSDTPRGSQTAIHRLTIPIELIRKTDGAIVLASSSDRTAAPDPALVKALARGFAWFEELATGRSDTVTAIAKRERVTDRYVSQLVELALIDPGIVQQVLAGTARSMISTTRLVFRTELPLMRAEQKDLIFADHHHPGA